MTPDVNPAKKVGFFFLFVCNIPVYQVLGAYDLCQPAEWFEESVGTSKAQSNAESFIYMTVPVIDLQNL